MCGIVGFTGRQNAAPILLEGLKKLEYRGYDSAGIAVCQNGMISVEGHMCGIVGFTGRQNAAPILLEGLKKLEYRGYDSAGIAVCQNGMISVSKVSGRIANLCEKTENGANMPGYSGIGHTRWATHGAPTDINAHPHMGRIANLCEKTENGANMPGYSGIGHTRWATHGAPTDINAHPHMSCDGRFSIVHNGIIENYLELREELIANGYTFRSQTDTEVIVHLLEMYYDGDRFSIVHNGIIENYLELREELIANGYTFRSQTDTEVIVHLLEMYYDGDFKAAVMKTTSRLEGSYAIGVLCADCPGTIMAVREASPLILGIGVGESFFASDVTALVAYTRNTIYLDDGEFAELTPERITVYDCTGTAIQKPVSRITWSVEAAEKGGYEHFMLKEIMEQELTPERITVYDCTGTAIQKPVSRITWSVEAAEKGGYEHFMLKEIMEQPRAVKSALAPRIQNDQIQLDDFSFTKEDLRGIKKIVVTACGSAYYAGCAGKYAIIVVTACGSAYYAGCAGKYAIEKLCHIPVDVQLASELRYGEPQIDSGTLLIVLSQSGETADTIAAMKECQSLGARVLAIVNVVGSTIAKLAWPL